MTLKTDYFYSTMTKDLFELVVGDKIGEGIGRQVFEYLPDPELVIKFEDKGGSFQNVIEWNIWQRVQWVKGVHIWFAPCERISPCGTILLQKKTFTGDKKKYPLKLPAYLTDTQYSNYGFMKGNRFVCHDYGSNLMVENGMTSRMRKVKWV